MEEKMKKYAAAMIVFATLAHCCYGGTNQMQFAKDGFPAGQNTPEGVACDAVRAYANCDPELWLSTLVKPIYGPEPNKEYEKFKKQMVELKKDNKKNPNFPKMKIAKCYKARPLSMNGPHSAAYAMADFHGNMFVDLVIKVDGQKEQSIRYHVLMDKAKRWYFEPRPDLCPLFSMGLNDETKSTEEIERPEKKKSSNKPDARDGK
jgi:hypothetical protein